MTPTRRSRYDTAHRVIQAITDEVLDDLEREARKVLRSPTLHEFVMGNGTACFTRPGPQEGWSDGGLVNWRLPTVSPSDYAYMAPVQRILDEWDDELHLTGCPMRFTEHGPRVTEW